MCTKKIASAIALIAMAILLSSAASATIPKPQWDNGPNYIKNGIFHCPELKSQIITDANNEQRYIKTWQYVVDHFNELPADLKKSIREVSGTLYAYHKITEDYGVLTSIKLKTSPRAKEKLDLYYITPLHTHLQHINNILQHTPAYTPNCITPLASALSQGLTAPITNNILPGIKKFIIYKATFGDVEALKITKLWKMEVEGF